MTRGEPCAAAFGPSPPLRGTASLPGDKSISHRALILAAMAVGRSRIEGLSEGTDVAATASALRALGARIERSGSGWDVDGVGTGALLQPAGPLDLGNSGTSARLLIGLLATHPVTATLTGDASLSGRPMARLLEPLRRLGAEFSCAPGGRLPLTVRGQAPAAPLTHRLSLPSAQVKSALLLSGLNAAGVTRVIERVPTRDHGERLLRAFGADLSVERDGEDVVLGLAGEAALRPQRLEIPGDPSAAAFLAVAALIVPGSELRLEGVCINPTRTALFTVLREMGGDLRFVDQREQGGEPAADILVRHSPLRGIGVPPELAPAMIDEFPIFFIAAAFAQGESRTSGLGELRLKESDRLAAMAAGLAAVGAVVKETGDGLIVRGNGGERLPGGATIDSRLDHRIAMSFAVAGLHSRNSITVNDMAPVRTSFPDFAPVLARLASER
jgi:3-phosphoshikimate 1-carboxyvinyltransferase